MREILFRGQTRKKGEKVRLDGTPIDSNWVYGGVAKFNEERAIIYQTEPEFHKFSVYADTVGQFTGLKDKNGVRVFDGDILSAHFDESYPDDETLLLVENNGYAFTLKEGYSAPEMINDADMRFFDETFVVIGNVFDNPELLEGELK